MMGEIVERVRKVESPRFARSAISRVINPWRKQRALHGSTCRAGRAVKTQARFTASRWQSQGVRNRYKGVASIGLLATSSTRRKCLREFSNQPKRR
jgi:hypothetical protein